MIAKIISMLALSALLLTAAQNGWRWCNKCQGLFYGNNPSKGLCPADGNAHDAGGSMDYELVANAANQGQSKWRWCGKCEGLFFSGNSTQGVCPRGGGHDSSHSMDCSLQARDSVTGGQDNWRWYNKCQGLAFGGDSEGSSPRGGQHSLGGSMNYALFTPGARPFLPQPPPPPLKPVTVRIDKRIGDLDSVEFAVWTNPGGKPLVVNYRSDDESCGELREKRGTIAYKRVEKNFSIVRVTGLKAGTSYCLVAEGVAPGKLKAKVGLRYNSPIRLANPVLIPTR